MQAPQTMMERILHLMAEKKASDVYLSAHAPATIRINGVCHNINNQPLPPEATLNLLMDILPPNRIEELRETGELNTAVPLHGVGNFRISAMRQRGSYAAVIRYISPTIPRLDTLNLPSILEQLVLEKRGLIRREECAEDSRGADVVLSEEGLKAFRSGSIPHLEAVRELFIDALSPDELSQLKAVTRSLRLHLE